MLIPYDKGFTNPHHAIICESSDCKFKQECANHSSAGDFRSEDGFSPKLTVESGRVNCETYHSPALYGTYDCYPVEYNQLDRGTVCWKDVPEMVDSYQI